MPRGGANNVKYHTCPDGQTRRVEPVYFRLENSQGGRSFQRQTWYCPVCRYADGLWSPNPTTMVTER